MKVSTFSQEDQTMPGTGAGASETHTDTTTFLDETQRFDSTVKGENSRETCIPVSESSKKILPVESLSSESGDTGVNSAGAKIEADTLVINGKYRGRQRPLRDVKHVLEQNAWDDIEWNNDQKMEAALKVEQNSCRFVNQDVRFDLEKKASENWDKFYGIHQNKFFRIRTWLFTEFPDLIGPFEASMDTGESKLKSAAKRENEAFPGENSGFRVLEVGCGNGSTVLPLLKYNNHHELYVYGCDFSTEAVRIVSQHPDLDTNRCTPFVWDITQESAILPFPPESIDVVTIIFVLSAISPDKFDQVFQNLYDVLKPNGIILFRDYGVHDMVQLRIKPGKCISENFYFRGDRTRVYFFDEAELEELFLRNGYSKLTLFTDKRLQVNRLKQLKMFRIWIQGRYRKSSQTVL